MLKPGWGLWLVRTAPQGRADSLGAGPLVSPFLASGKGRPRPGRCGATIPGEGRLQLSPRTWSSRGHHHSVLSRDKALGTREVARLEKARPRACRPDVQRIAALPSLGPPARLLWIADPARAKVWARLAHHCVPSNWNSARHVAGGQRTRAV